MIPRCSSRRTRWCTADTDSPTRSARSVYDNRPSSVNARTIARSVSSTPSPYRQDFSGIVSRGGPRRSLPRRTEPLKGAQPMKFAMLICGDDSEWSNLPSDEEQDVMKRIYEWYERWQPTGKIADGGVELQPRTTARTIRTGADGGAVV